MTLGMLAVAVALGIDVFAGGLSLGVRGLERKQWARTAAVFALIAFLMTALGVLFGRLLGDRFGAHASYIAGALLLVIGARAIIDALLGETDDDLIEHPPDRSAVILTGVMVCIDKLAVGFAIAFLDTSPAPMIAALVVISFAATLLGLWSGQFLGAKSEHIAEYVAGGLFIMIGVVIIYQTAFDRSYI